MTIKKFQSLIWHYYQLHKREMPWRPPSLQIQKNGSLDPYKIVVSEIMLQQTQVSRVLEKYPLFIQQFPSFACFASATFESVLRAWQGMGYNRRAKYLHTLARIIIKSYSGEVPHDPHKLEKLPGIGPATARSITTFAYNKPEVFIETNIRRVFIHHFFDDASNVDDADIEPLVKKTLDTNNPREWYWALMDYGAGLAKSVPNPNRKSKHYNKQSKFEGSNRQICGLVLQSLLAERGQTREHICMSLDFENERIYLALKDMEQEGFVREHKGVYEISD